MRIYIPAKAGMLRALAETGELRPVCPVHLVSAALRKAAPDADVDDLEYTAFTDAALASLTLLVGDISRRVVVSADVSDDRVTERGESTEALLDGAVGLGQIAAIHIDDADAADEIDGVLGAFESPDLDAVEAHVLEWFHPSELGDLLSSLDSSRP